MVSIYMLIISNTVLKKASEVEIEKKVKVRNKSYIHLKKKIFFSIIYQTERKST